MSEEEMGLSRRLTAEQVKQYRVAALAEKCLVALLPAAGKVDLRSMGEVGTPLAFAHFAASAAEHLVRLAPYPEEGENV